MSSIVGPSLDSVLPSTILPMDVAMVSRYTDPVESSWTILLVVILEILDVIVPTADTSVGVLPSGHAGSNILVLVTVSTKPQVSVEGGPEAKVECNLRVDTELKLEICTRNALGVDLGTEQQPGLRIIIRLTPKTKEPILRTSSGNPKIGGSALECWKMKYLATEGREPSIKLPIKDLELWLDHQVGSTGYSHLVGRIKGYPWHYRPPQICPENAECPSTYQRSSPRCSLIRVILHPQLLKVSTKEPSYLKG